MTNHWSDLQHCKTILVEGSNVAENHPMAFKWIRKAQENGAIIIHVDPRFSRTSATADIYARIRPGADVAFLNAMINHVLVNKLYDEDYVTTHTNALFLGDERFDFKDGLFSGYDADQHTYDTSTWGYQLDGAGRPRRAASLDDPRCIFARLKTFVSRYTLEIGERITGIPAAQIQQIAETMAKNRPGSILYALGMTQHTTGVQGIRAFTILQLLLGNVGKPGGGVNALRGEPNVQGACDMGVLNNYLPGYLDYPTNGEPTLAAWTKKQGTENRALLVNTLKAFYGDAATPENDFGYEWLPKRNAAQGPQHLRHLRERAGRDDEDALDRRPEPGGDDAEPARDVRRARQARHAGRAGAVGDGDGGVLAAPRRRREVDQDRSAAAARGLLHGEGRQRVELGRHGAVALSDGQPARSGETRRRDRRPRVPARPRSGEGFDRGRGT